MKFYFTLDFCWGCKATVVSLLDSKFARILVCIDNLGFKYMSRKGPVVLRDVRLRGGLRV